MMNYYWICCCELFSDDEIFRRGDPKIGIPVKIQSFIIHSNYCPIYNHVSHCPSQTFDIVYPWWMVMLLKWLFSLGFSYGQQGVTTIFLCARSQDMRKMNHITITIRSGKNFASLMKWKEKRLLEITKLCLEKVDKYDDLFGYCMLGNQFSTLTKLKICHSYDVQLQPIFFFL